MDPEIKGLVTALIEGQSRTEKSIGDLARLVGSHVEMTDSRTARIDEAHVVLLKAQASTELAIANLAVSVGRAIAREHQNGKL
jgi:hypothetical protein